MLPNAGGVLGPKVQYAGVDPGGTRNNRDFLRPAGGHWRLMPAFDLTHVYRPDSKWNGRHLMAINGKFDGITREDLFAVGERRDVPGYRRIVREVQQAVVEWPTFAAEADSRIRL